MADLALYCLYTGVARLDIVCQNKAVQNETHV